MTFRVNIWKVFGTWSIMIFLVAFSIINNCAHILKAKTLGDTFDWYPYSLFSYVLIAIWLVWHIVSISGCQMEITDTEIMLINRSGKVIKSRGFDEISELKAFEVSPPYRLSFTKGKEWRLDQYYENFERLKQLIEERTGKTFQEPTAKPSRFTKFIG